MQQHITDILQKFPQYESIPYAIDFNCVECGSSGYTGGKAELVGWCDCWNGFMVVLRCPFCGNLFRFHPHINKFDFDEFDRYVGRVFVYSTDPKASNSQEIKRAYERAKNNIHV